MYPCRLSLKKKLTGSIRVAAGCSTVESAFVDRSILKAILDALFVHVSPNEFRGIEGKQRAEAQNRVFVDAHFH